MPAPSRRGILRRRRGMRTMTVITLVGLILIGAIGLQSWRVLGAIVRAERVAVVPLPARDAALVDPPASTDDTGVAVTASPAPGPAVGGMTTSEPVLASDTSTSHLDVVRDVVAASLDTGDPGRSAVWQGKTAINILVVGVDRRPDGGDQNADVLIIAHLDLIAKRIAAVSLPRDLLVDVPGVGADKINSAYNHGVQRDPNDPAAGIALVRDTIESVFGVPIDAYVLIDFNGFKDVVDAIGGVDVDVPYEIVDDAYPTEDYGIESIRFEPGPQHMDGDSALKYVRTRHADSDDARRNRQLQVLLALFDEGKSLKSISRADKIIGAGGESVQTSFALDQQIQLARIALAMNRNHIRLTTLGQPILTGTILENGRWVYTGDQTAIVNFVHAALDTTIRTPVVTTAASEALSAS